MKIRTAEQLLDHLDDEMAWRLKELHALSSAVRQAKGKYINAHIRAGVAMLYAHWEGFVKSAANAYVAYIGARGDLNRDLQPCFVALAMRFSLSANQESGKAAVAVSTLTSMLADMDKPIRFPRVDVLSTQSNLSSIVFLNIAAWIGIDPAPYTPRFTLIDKTLLETRNAIAHGEFLVIDQARFESLTTEILEMLRWFKTDIENAVARKSFLKLAD